MLSMSASLPSTQGNAINATKRSARQVRLRHSTGTQAKGRTRTEEIAVEMAVGAELVTIASDQDLFGATRPSRPAGRNTSTSTRIEKMITSAHDAEIN